MIIAFILLLTLNNITIRGLDNGLARTPPMGWLSWERYRCIIDCKHYPFDCISEWMIRNVTDLIVEQGYLDVGYEYVIVDDCWLASTRDKSGDLQPDSDRFPNGIKALADYVHSKGLKFGIYEDYGNFTCAGYPGVLGNLERDANKFAEWGVDYVKLDGCYSAPEDMDTGYPEFGNYLNKTGRQIVYSCSWPAYQEDINITINFSLIAKHCNLWWNSYDINDSWSSVNSIFNHFAENQDTYTKYAGPGHWNDPDMLVIGNFGLSYDQSKVQMAIWAILAGPLLMSTDLRAMRPEFKAILQNKEIIAVNQDTLGIQGKRLFVRDNIQVWARPILPKNQEHHSYAVAFVNVNEGGQPYKFKTNLKELNLFNTNGYKVQDLYDQKSNATVITKNVPIETQVNPSGVVFLLFEVITDEPLVKTI